MCLLPLALDTHGLHPFGPIKDALLLFGSSLTALLFLGGAVSGSQPGAPPTGGSNTGLGAKPVRLRLALALPLTAAAFWLWSIIAPAWTAANPALHAWGATRLTAYLVVFALVAAAAGSGSSGRGLRLIAGAVACSALVMMLHACLQAAGFDPLSLIAGPIRESGRWRVFTTTGNPNWTAEYLAAATPLAAWSIDRRWPALMPWVWLTSGAAVLATGSRLALVALAAGGAWYAWTSGSPSKRERLPHGRARPPAHADLARWGSANRWRWLALAAAALAVVIVYARGSWGVSDLEGRWLDWGSVTGRWGLMRAAWSLILAHPLVGNGLGHFAVLLPAGLRSFVPALGPAWQNLLPHQLSDHAHNDVLESAVESGLPAGALLAALFLFGLALAWRNRHTSAPAALGAALLALLVTSLGSAPLHTPATGLLFWTVLGLLVAVNGGGMPIVGTLGGFVDQKLLHERRRRVTAVSLLVCLLAASVATGVHGLRALRANRLAAVASVLRSVGRDAEAQDHYQTVLRLAPWDAESAVALASLALAQGDATTALDWLHHAQAWSASSEAWLVEASAWQRLDQPQKAIPVLEGAVAALPDDIGARLRLGNLYALAGRTDAALVAYRRVLASDQDSEQAQLIKREAERAASVLAAVAAP